VTHDAFASFQFVQSILNGRVPKSASAERYKLTVLDLFKLKEGRMLGFRNVLLLSVTLAATVGLATEASATVIDVVYTGTINGGFGGNPPIDGAGLFGPVNGSLSGDKVVMEFLLDTANTTYFADPALLVPSASSVKITVSGVSQTFTGDGTDSYYSCNLLSCGNIQQNVNNGALKFFIYAGALGAVRNAVGIRCGAFSGNMKVSFQAARSIG
jgi:hypothetical protein